MECNEPLGVLVGCDALQEWLLSWFYDHFRKHNPDCPIAFADFGMTPEGQQWCAERGTLFKVPELMNGGSDQPGSLFEGEFWQQWQSEAAEWTPQPHVYFKKPSALALSPFYRTLWLDLDCQVRGDLSPLMSLPISPDGLGATLTGSVCLIKNLSQERIVAVAKYSTGVLLAEKNSALLNEWVALINGGISFCTDEECLAFLAAKKQLPMALIPYECNWPVPNWGENAIALIYHWIGKEGKSRLKALLNEDVHNLGREISDI